MSVCLYVGRYDPSADELFGSEHNDDFDDGCVAVAVAVAEGPCAIPAPPCRWSSSSWMKTRGLDPDEFYPDPTPRENLGSIPYLIFP